MFDDWVRITYDNIDLYFPAYGGLGWGPDVPPGPTPTGTGHSTRDMIIGLINRGLDVFLQTKNGQVYTQGNPNLAVDQSGGLQLSPTMLLLIFAGVFLLFRQPPGRR